MSKAHLEQCSPQHSEVQHLSQASSRKEKISIREISPVYHLMRNNDKWVTRVRRVWSADDERIFLCANASLHLRTDVELHILEHVGAPE